MDTLEVEEGLKEMAIKTCGETNCEFYSAKTISNDNKDRSVSTKKLAFAIIMCLTFTVVEVVFGIKAHSLAILTDAAHLLSDVACFAISIFAIYASGWKPTPRMTFGYFRIEILLNLFSIQSIWVLAVVLVYEAITRFGHKHKEIKGPLMFGVACFGLVVNLVMVFVLGHDHHGHSHAHDHHGHSHDHDHQGHSHDHDHQRHSQSHGHSHDHDHHEHSHDYDHQQHSHDHDHHGHSHDHEHHEHFHDHEHSHDHEHHGHSHNHEQHGHSHNHEHHGNSHDHDHHEHSHAHDHHGHSHDREHGHDHHNEKREEEDGIAEGSKVRKEMNISVQGAYLHVIGDLIQSVGVLISAGLIWWKPKLHILDLICTLIFSVLAVWRTRGTTWKLLKILMETTPKEIDCTKITEGLCNMDEVIEVHELHVWAITVGKVCLTCHIRIKPEADTDMMLDKVIEYIKREFKISHVTIQVEREHNH